MSIHVANREKLELLVVTMHAEGWSIRELCRRFKIGRNTVRASCATITGKGGKESSLFVRGLRAKAASTPICRL